jgi:hypothetical protein
VVCRSAYGAVAFLGAAAITGNGDMQLLSAGDLVEDYLFVRTAEFLDVAADSRSGLVEVIISTPTLAVAFTSVLCAVSNFRDEPPQIPD